MKIDVLLDRPPIIEQRIKQLPSIGDRANIEMAKNLYHELDNNAYRRAQLEFAVRNEDQDFGSLIKDKVEASLRHETNAKV